LLIKMWLYCFQLCQSSIISCFSKWMYDRTISYCMFMGGGVMLEWSLWKHL